MRMIRTRRYLAFAGLAPLPDHLIDISRRRNDRSALAAMMWDHWTVPRWTRCNGPSHKAIRLMNARPSRWAGRYLPTSPASRMATITTQAMSGL